MMKKRIPPQELSETRLAGDFFECYITDPLQGVPCFGAAEFIVPDGSVTIPVSYLNNPNFRGKAPVSQTHANMIDNHGSFIAIPLIMI